MNQAADNIEAKSRSLKDILYEKHYKVGYFQREYKWKRTHIEDLLIDLERSFNQNYEKSHGQHDVAKYSKYYMGPIVLFMDDSEFSIVDGQQRLTSFVLLMIYLNKKLEEIAGTRDKLKGYIYSEHYGVKAYNMNIEDRVKILDILYKGVDSDESVFLNESCKTINDRYYDINELFPPGLLERSVLPLFTTWITEKLVFIEIMTQSSESAYTIFETMNDRGLNLTQTELLKSFLLSNVNNEERIAELDKLWKKQIYKFNLLEEDQDFFKAWLRAKYALSIRTSEKDSENKDFEKIGTRFSSWVQENAKYKKNDKSILLLDIKDPDSFYFFVKSDFGFFSDAYLRLKELETSNALPEHRFKLILYKGVSPSLSNPLVLAPLQKSDVKETINEKIEVVINFIDAFGIYRILIGQSITHSSVRNYFYLKIKEIRNSDIGEIKNILGEEIRQLKNEYLKIDYTYFDYNSKYVLARIYKDQHEETQFDLIYFQRRKESFSIYQFLKIEDFETSDMGLPKGLKDRIVERIVSYTIVPRSMISELDKLDFKKRIEYLRNCNLLLETPDDPINIDFKNLKNYFINREKALKDQIIKLWKI